MAAPNPRIIEMVKQGLTTDAICAELGMRPRGLEHHITLARKQGLLPPSKFDPRRIDREAVLEAWAKGMTRRGIIEAGLATTARSVEAIITRARVAGDPRAVRRDVAPGKRISDADVVALRDQGVSIKETARRIGCHHSTVKKILEGISGDPAEPEPAPYTPPPIRRRVSALLPEYRIPEIHRPKGPPAPSVIDRVPDPAALARAANRSPAVLSTRWADGWEGA